MGVYHLMGLGLSPGAITGAISYLGHRYERWNDSDREFFGRSGETVQRNQGEKVGDVQSLVLFTTHEVINGHEKGLAQPHINNQFGSTTGIIIDKDNRQPMKKVLSKILSKELHKLSKGRAEIDIFWVEIDRRNAQSTYQRVMHIITALANVGGQGKEIWANLTGGTNVINFAIQLAATLSGAVARLYYTQSPNEDSDKCIRCPIEEGYWIELPLMPLNLTPLSVDAIQRIEAIPGINLKNLNSHLVGYHWKELENKDLRRDFLAPLWKQGLIANDGDSYKIGPRWEPIKPYVEFLEQIRGDQRTLEQLSQDGNESWITRQTLSLRS